MANKTDVKKLKMIFFLFLLLSNAIIYMLSSASDQGQFTQPDILIREGHITLKISGDLKTVFDPFTPVTLVSKDKTRVIKNVFLLKKINEGKMNITEDLDSSSDFYIEVHKSKFKDIERSKFFYIYPNEISYSTTRRSKRKKYEITY